MASRKKRFWENKEVDKDIGSITYIDTTKLETEDEKKARIRSLWVIYIQTFIFDKILLIWNNV